MKKSYPSPSTSRFQQISNPSNRPKPRPFIFKGLRHLTLQASQRYFEQSCPDQSKLQGRWFTGSHQKPLSWSRACSYIAENVDLKKDVSLTINVKIPADFQPLMGQSFGHPFKALKHLTLYHSSSGPLLVRATLDTRERLLLASEHYRFSEQSDQKHA